MLSTTLFRIEFQDQMSGSSSEEFAFLYSKKYWKHP